MRVGTVFITPVTFIIKLQYGFIHCMDMLHACIYCIYHAFTCSGDSCSYRAFAVITYMDYDDKEIMDNLTILIDAMHQTTVVLTNNISWPVGYIPYPLYYSQH